jgi:hypothetical protein
MTHRLAVVLVLVLCLLVTAITLTYDGFVEVEQVIGAPGSDEAE